MTITGLDKRTALFILSKVGARTNHVLIGAILVGIVLSTGIEAISRVLVDPNTAVPELIRGSAKLLVEEIRLLEARIAQVERELAA
ncbi:MAG: hypothetical protein ACK5OI_07530, partial [Curvibacter sp.]